MSVRSEGSDGRACLGYRIGTRPTDRMIVEWRAMPALKPQALIDESKIANTASAQPVGAALVAIARKPQWRLARVSLSPGLPSPAGPSSRVGLDQAAKTNMAVCRVQDAPAGESGICGLSCAGRSAPAHGHPAADSPAALRGRHGVIRFQHLRKISSILIRNIVAPLAIRTAPGSCSLTEGRQISKNPGVVMSVIPLDLQRRCERRWAARFCRPASPAAPQSQPQQQQLSEPPKAKRKTRRVKSAGLRLVPPV